MENKYFDFHEIKTFEDACKHLGLNSGSLTYPAGGDRDSFLRAWEYYQLLIIQKSINHGVWIHEDSRFLYTPFFSFYSEKTVKGMSDVEKRKICIDRYIPCIDVYTKRKVYALIMYPIPFDSDEFTNSFIPFRFNSDEAALYAARQFKDLFLKYYGYEILK